ncbi:hypothetical protein [Neobacillus niacini]|uniref:hypothetical protein n=1 Tax=Neobacillus niacini TaxID=86668 RepID=UPI002041A8ED|nr:hypothetical protein [Neobacillus niacini]MCM3694271.1 hypothetical protein [Neobacillus niacini]
MKRMISVTDKLYTWLALITMALGVSVAFIFIVSLAIGGSTGESIAVFAGKLMTWGIRIAAVATLSGIINIYLKKEHTLTMETADPEEIQKEIKLNGAEGTV